MPLTDWKHQARQHFYNEHLENICLKPCPLYKDLFIEKNNY